jgi:site-specific DNA recombinase
MLIITYKDEAAHTVKGQQEGIIPETLYYDVQAVLSGKKRPEKTKVASPDMLPLRGL